MKAAARQLFYFFFLLVFTGMVRAADNQAFSDEFLSAVEAAMQSADYRERIRQIHAALDQGTDSEVLYVSAIIIPRQVLSVAREDKVCKEDITALSYELQFVVDVGADAYLQEHADTFRSTLKNMVACIHTAYREGVPVR